MTSNLLSNVMVITLAHGLAAPPMDNPSETVFIVARVEGVTKRLGKDDCVLLAIKRDIRPLFSSAYGGSLWSITDEKNRQWLVNGIDKSGLPGKPDAEVELLWVQLPESGNLEFMFGSVNSKDGNEKLTPRERLIKEKYIPFKVDVKDIPVVKGKTAEEVSKLILALPAPKKDEKK